MRSRFHRAAFPVQDTKDFCLDIAAVRLHDLDRLPDTELVLLFRDRKAVFIDPLHDPQEYVIADVSAAPVDLILFIRPAIKEPGRERSVRTVRDLLRIPGHILFIEGGILRVRVHREPVCPGSRRHVKGGLHSSLDLKAVDPGVEKIRNVLDHAEISRIENERSPLIFLDRHILTGSRLLHDRILPSAGMCTEPSVRITSRHVIREQTSPRIGNAHRPMDKSLDLEVVGNVRANIFYFPEGELSGRHDPLRSEFPPEKEGFIIRVVRLCADVQLQLRCMALCKHEHTRIRDKHSVRPDLRKLLKISRSTFKIRVMRYDIGSDIDLCAVRVRERNALTHLPGVKIMRLRPQSVGLPADIDCIRSEKDSDLQDVQAACRQQ